MNKSLFARFFVFIFIATALTAIVGFGAQMALKNEFISFGAAITVAVISTLAIAKLLSNNIASPLMDLIQIAELVEKGQKGAPIEGGRKDELGQLINAMNNLTDRDQAVKQANEDPLTGLGNRRYLEQQLKLIFNKKSDMALIFIDLDGFKPINDDYGHEAGDEALKQVAERLGACIRDNDIVCRLGGDEFVIGIIGTSNRDIITERADKILEMINQPYWFGNTRMRMGASLGIAIAPDDADTAEELLNAADESMYAAKQGGKNAYRFYS